MGEALSRLVLELKLHLFCVGTMRPDMLSSMWIQTSRYGSLTSVLCQDLDVLAHVVCLVDWPKHVTSFFLFFSVTLCSQVSVTYDATSGNKHALR